MVRRCAVAMLWKYGQRSLRGDKAGCLSYDHGFILDIGNVVKSNAHQACDAGAAPGDPVA